MISGLAQPDWPARTRAHTMATTLPVRSTTPSRSSRSGAPWLSGSSRMRERQGDDPDRHVDPEDPVPVDALGDRAADDRPHRDGQAGESAVDADDHPAPFGRESGRQDGEAAAGGRSRRPGPARVRAAISVGDVRGERAGRRGHGEQGEADGEDPAAAEAVAEGGRGDDAGREGDVVRGERPLERRQAGVQVALHAGQRRGHDHRVENDHEVGGRGQAENPAKMGPSQGFCHNHSSGVHRFALLVM